MVHQDFLVDTGATITGVQVRRIKHLPFYTWDDDHNVQLAVGPSFTVRSVLLDLVIADRTINNVRVCVLGMDLIGVDLLCNFFYHYHQHQHTLSPNTFMV